MKHINAFIAIVFSLVYLCTIAVAQEESLKTAMKAGQPAEQHEMLQRLVGEWDVSVKFKIGGEWNEGKSSCVSKMILGDRFLKQTYESKMFGRPFSVIQTFGYDNVAENFIETHMNNMNTGIDVRQGVKSKDGKSIEFTGEKIDPASKKTERIRTVLTIIDDDNFEIVWYQTLGDTDEQKTVTLSHVRKTKE